jgi:hypothetical protein
MLRLKRLQHGEPKSKKPTTGSGFFDSAGESFKLRVIPRP